MLIAPAAYLLAGLLGLLSLALQSQVNARMRSPPAAGTLGGGSPAPRALRGGR